MSGPRVAFVIPHKGREALLRATLESIAAQVGDIPFDVAVITQNPTLSDETLALAARIPVTFRYADPGLTISALRNRGARETDAPYLAFLDADIALAPHWLERMVTLLEADPGRVLCSAMQASGDDAPVLEQIRVALSNATLDAPVRFLPGRNLLLRRGSYEAVGGFPEKLRTCEDYWFTDRIGAHGILWYSSESSYIHLGEDRQLAQMFTKEIWRGQSNLQSLAGRRIPASEWPSFIVPIWVTMLTAAAVSAALLGRLPVVVVCGLAALAPAAAYVTRLYFLAERSIPLRHIVAFYALYFPARAWGTLIGAFRRIGHQLHDR
jgi:glycosyltransferase involved in cell wall biosynthesis